MSLIRHNLQAGDVVHLWSHADQANAGVSVRFGGREVAVLAARASADPLRQQFTAAETGAYELSWDGDAVRVSLAYSFTPERGIDAAITPLWTTPDNELPADGPAFHFTPPWGWMNDPNGVCRVDGVFHLFYQHMPHMRRRYRTIVHWGHAVSRDGLDWTHLPIFLSPREELLVDGSAGGGAYSGSAIADPEGGLRIFYTDREDARLPEREWQQTFRTADTLAPSEAESTVIEARPDLPGIKNDFRDPFVFMGPDGLWKMVLGSRTARGGVVLLYETDAENAEKDWRFVAQIASFGAYGLGAAECPCLLPLGDSGLWAMPVSLICDHRPTRRRNLSFVLVGSFDGKTFTQHSLAELDHGPDCYAFQGNVADGETFGIAWAANWSEMSREADGPTSMTLPRRMEWRGDHLATPPSVDTAPLRSAISGDLTRDGRIALPDGTAEIEMELAADGAPLSIVLELEDRAVTFDVKDGAMILDHDEDGRKPVYRAEGKPSHLRIFVDIGIVEIYADDGRWCFTKRLDQRRPVKSVVVKDRSSVRRSAVWGLQRTNFGAAGAPRKDARKDERHG